MMIKYTVALNTRANKFDSTEGEPSSKDPPPTLPPNGPLTLEKPASEPSFHPPKGVLQWTIHRTNDRVGQNYIIVEDLAQALCAMSTLEVL
jgi:hypothetical protein